MSRTKNLEKPETENEVTENLVEQSEFEGLTSDNEVVTENKPEIEQPVKKVARINKVASVAAVKGNKRMGVAKFLSYYPQDYYIEALLRVLYPRSVFTVEEWFMRIEEMLNIPINS